MTTSAREFAHRCGDSPSYLRCLCRQLNPALKRTQLLHLQSPVRHHLVKTTMALPPVVELVPALVLALVPRLLMW